MLPTALTVFQARTKRACADRALVLRAINIPFAIQNMADTWILMVPEEFAGQALGELRSYEEENVGFNEKPPPPVLHTVGKPGLLTYALLICAIFPAGLYGMFGLNFWLAGRMDSALVLEGQWWRPITSLTLHADLGHIAANLFFGLLFGALTSQALGVGLTWSATLLAGTIGNLLTTLIEGPGHLAVGASTAVFGTLGLFTVYEWARRNQIREAYPRSYRYRPIATLLAGAVLLGFLGMGGEDNSGRVDVLSHLTGFVSGSVLGALFAWLRWPVGWTPKHQLIAGVTSTAVILLAWIVALSA
ncbi:MAG: rhomboid family intramembrane serine protease [Planctomycetota bacterium]|nr:rhomboid family intramembrane serine protease [Planctomycetota bacterium]